MPHSERHFTAVTFKSNLPPRSSRNSNVFCEPNRLHSFFVHTLISSKICRSHRIILVVVLVLVAAFRRDDDDDETRLKEEEDREKEEAEELLLVKLVAEKNI